MTREELQTKQEQMWQALSGEQSMTLTLAVGDALALSFISVSDPYQNNDSSGRLATRFLKDSPSAVHGRLPGGVSLVRRGGWICGRECHLNEI
jgi:hypothetical protein